MSAMKLESERLLLLPLRPEELRLLCFDLPELERRLNISYQAEPVEGVFSEIIRNQLEICERRPESYLWDSFWLLLRREDRVAVGSADFKAPPDEQGRVEIGYGLGKAFRGQGYMSEAVSAICRWALSQPGVKNILAGTEGDNLPSQSVLRRCGFCELARGGIIWWIL